MVKSSSDRCRLSCRIVEEFRRIGARFDAFGKSSEKLCAKDVGAAFANLHASFLPVLAVQVTIQNDAVHAITIVMWSDIAFEICSSATHSDFGCSNEDG